MMTGAPSQVEELEKKLPAPSFQDSTKPRMPFNTAYVLTREQEDALVEHALKRLDQIETQLGKTSGTQGMSRNGSNRGDFTVSCDPASHFGKRQKYTARYYNHVEDREKKGTIYEHSNVTASLSQRICGQMIAKSSAFFFGQPDDQEWFTAEGIGIEDAGLGDKVKKYARFVASKCEVKARHVQANEFAWVRGEAVVKTVNREQFQIFQRTATILVQSEDPKSDPILDAFGDYIVEGDAVVDQMEEFIVPQQEPGEAMETAGAETTEHQGPAAEPVEAQEVTMQRPTGQKILKRDGVTVMPAAPIYRTEKITKKIVTFEGPDSTICYYMDFLAPLDAPGIQPGEADLIAHLYDKSVMDVAQMFGDQYAEGDQGVADFSAAVELLRNMLSATPQPKSAAGQPREDFDEQDTDASPNNPRIQVAECWLTYDANGDGVQEEILLILDRGNRAPIFYEYTANMTLRGLRPFEVIRPMEVDGRWWGMGAMEYFDPEQEFIDLLINRKNFREGGSGRVTFWAPWATMEGQRDPRLKLNHGKTYTLREGCKAEQALSYIQLPEDTTDLRSMIDLYMQLMQTKGGVVNGADQEMSGLPTADTATGINEVRESGDELFGMFLLRLHRGLSRALAAVIDVTFSNLNRRQVFTYFNGEATVVLELTPDDVRDLALNVRFSITRTRDRQVLEAGDVADRVVDTFYARPLMLQERTASLARSRLKALRVPQPDLVIEPMDPSIYMPPTLPPGSAPADPMAV